VAAETFARFINSRQMIPLFIEFGGKLKNTLGAKLDAIPTPLTSIVNYIHSAIGNLNFF
jgi:hypothetical protein